MNALRARSGKGIRHTAASPKLVTIGRRLNAKCRARHQVTGAALSRASGPRAGGYLTTRLFRIQNVANTESATERMTGNTHVSSMGSPVFMP